MYTILVNEANELITTVKERIMQRSKLVDKLHFLVDPIYKDHDMSTFTVIMEYITPISREYKTEILVLSDELYKEKLEYTLPFDTNLTKENVNIELQLTFVRVEMNDEGKSIQRVRKTSSTTITVIPINAWSNIIPDDALTALDQRIIMTQAMIEAANEMSQYLNDSKADDISYNDDTRELQLLAGGNPVGNKITIKCDAADLEDGLPVVDFNRLESTDTNPEDDYNVVEF